MIFSLFQLCEKKYLAAAFSSDLRVNLNNSNSNNNTNHHICRGAYVKLKKCGEYAVFKQSLNC